MAAPRARAKKPAAKAPSSAYPLLFADVYGLVRYSPPDRRVKNLARTDGASGYSVRGDRILVIDAHGYGTLYGSDLARPARARNFAEAPLSPVGSGVLLLSRGAFVLRDGSTEYEIPRSPPAVQIALALTLGASWAPAVREQNHCYASVDGAVALTSDGVHFDLGALSGPAVHMTTDVRVTLPERRPPAFVVYPGREVHVLCSFDPAVLRAEVACVARDGATRTFEVGARELPVRADDELFVLAADGASVLRVALDGAVLERVELPDVLRGAGTVHANNGHAVFVSADREALFDLRSRVAIQRMLPAKELPVRAYFARLEARLRPLADAAHARVGLCALGVGANNNPPSFWKARYTDGGDGGLLANLVFGMFLHHETFMPPLDGWTARGTSSRSYTPRRDVSLDEAIEALARLDAEGLSLLHGLRDLNPLLREGADDLRAGRRPSRIDREAASLLFYVAARLHESSETLPSAPLVEQWRREALTPERGATLLDAACSVGTSTPLEQHRYGLVVPIAYFAAWAWGRKAEVVFERILRGPNSRWAGANASALIDPHAVAVHANNPANAGL